MHVPLPCASRWSDMTRESHSHRFCSSCEKKVFDFTRSTQEEFDAVRQKEGDQLCGRFYTDEQGTILFEAKRTGRRWQKIFLLALLLNFHQTMFSNVNMEYLHALNEKLVHLSKPNSEKVTLYGIAKMGRSRMSDATVRITVGKSISILTTTDDRGRFTFELAPTLSIDTLLIQVNKQRPVSFVLNESAAEASKRIYKLKFGRRFVSVGCPSF